MSHRSYSFHLCEFLASRTISVLWASNPWTRLPPIMHLLGEELGGGAFESAGLPLPFPPPIQPFVLILAAGRFALVNSVYLVYLWSSDELAHV